MPNMKLRYKHQSPPEQGVAVLLKGSHRIELYAKRRSEETFVLVALAGHTHTFSGTSKLQGPFHAFSQLAAARTAIMHSLIELNYLPSEAPAIWAIQAQREVNYMQNSLKDTEVDYQFDPKDVFFDTPAPKDR